LPDADPTRRDGHHKKVDCPSAGPLIDRWHHEETAAYRGSSVVVLDTCSPVVAGRRSDPPSKAGGQDYRRRGNNEADLAHLNSPSALNESEGELQRRACM